MNNFQTIVITIFLVFFVIGVLVFSGAVKIDRLFSKDNSPVGKVVIWGTFSTFSLNNVIEEMNTSKLTVRYEQKDPITYQQDLIEAFAEGKGPDLFIITPDMLKKNSNYIYKVPFESYPQKVFNDSFIEGASIYLDDKGVLGFPMVVDPMVMYYNKDILTNEGIVAPPKSWDELFNLNSVLTKKENSGKINQSMIAFGQYDNIKNIKDILATLLIQNDNQIVGKGVEGTYVSVLSRSNSSNFSVSPIEAVLRFFLEFSNPSNSAYSWNRSLPNSIDMFTSGKLAFYLGRASELFVIESVNPNLSFDVTEIPQIKGTNMKRTYGEIYGVVINKKSPNIASSLGVAGLLSLGDSAKNLSAAISLPSTSKALLAKKPATDPYLYTFFNSALVSRGWLDPDRSQTNIIFRDLIENILSNNLSIGESVNKASGQLDLLLKK